MGPEQISVDVKNTPCIWCANARTARPSSGPEDCTLGKALLPGGRSHRAPGERVPGDTLEEVRVRNLGSEPACLQSKESDRSGELAPDETRFHNDADVNTSNQPRSCIAREIPQKSQKISSGEAGVELRAGLWPLWPKQSPSACTWKALGGVCWQRPEMITIFEQGPTVAFCTMHPPLMIQPVLAELDQSGTPSLIRRVFLRLDALKRCKV